jgi:hypothetical protein
LITKTAQLKLLPTTLPRLTKLPTHDSVFKKKKNKTSQENLMSKPLNCLPSVREKAQSPTEPLMNCQNIPAVMQNYSNISPVI